MANNIIVAYMNFVNIGKLEGIFMIESIVEHISQTLDVPSEIVKEKNFYEKGQVMCNGCYGMDITSVPVCLLLLF